METFQQIPPNENSIFKYFYKDFIKHVDSQINST